MIDEKPVASTGLSFSDLYRWLEDVAWGKDNPNNLRGAGQLLLNEEDLGRIYDGSIIKLRIESCGRRRVRYLLYCGHYVIQTQQFECMNHDDGYDIARDYARIWLNNSIDFKLVRAYEGMQF